MEPEMTIGEQRVRTAFNPSEGQTHTEVDHIKNQFAAMINHCEQAKEKDPRLANITMTKLEECAMWMVKLVTAKPQ